MLEDEEQAEILFDLKKKGNKGKVHFDWNFLKRIAHRKGTTKNLTGMILNKSLENFHNIIINGNGNEGEGGRRPYQCFLPIDTQERLHQVYDYIVNDVWDWKGPVFDLGLAIVIDEMKLANKILADATPPIKIDINPHTINLWLDFKLGKISLMGLTESMYNCEG